MNTRYSLWAEPCLCLCVYLPTFRGGSKYVRSLGWPKATSPVGGSGGMPPPRKFWIRNCLVHFRASVGKKYCWSNKHFFLGLCGFRAKKCKNTLWWLEYWPTKSAKQVAKGGWMCPLESQHISLPHETEMTYGASKKCGSFAISRCPRMGSCPACTKFWQIRSFSRLFLPLLRAMSSWMFHDGDQDLEPQPGPGPWTDYSRPTVAHFTDNTCMCSVSVCASQISVCWCRMQWKNIRWWCFCPLRVEYLHGTRHP